MLANLSKNCLRLRHSPVVPVRTFLSENYKLQEAWNTRLASPIMEKINVETFHYELERKFNLQKIASPIDIDIYANKITDDNYFDEVGDLLVKLRKTAEATNILDSTGHAYIRNLIDFDQFESLIQVLDNRMDYGIFFDDFSANLAIDKLLKTGKFKEAARLATIFMLQEDFSNATTRALCLFACYKYLGNPEVFDDLKPPSEPEAEKGAKKKKVTEVKVRVAFLRNPYFDDHFDLKNSQHLVGKTFLLIGKELTKTGDTKLGTNIQLLGLGLYEKYTEAVKFLESTKGAELEKDVIGKINEALAKVGEEEQKNEAFQQFKNAIETIGSTHKVVESNFEEKLNDFCKNVVKENEAKDMEQQKKIYAAWNEIREKRLKEEIERLQRTERLKHIEKLTTEMEAEERKLWFFENEEQLNLDIESKRVFYPKRWFGKKKVPRKVDENYIPPDVDKRRHAE
ncbi:uncharacterized protein LOC134837060 [Culicoides brevitarsis]|uniref:uncharacterized protein LOC134837060 n=1 Tax=Culicoides brevitarsis TaxID=469753 RepID=UPI00307B62FE